MLRTQFQMGSREQDASLSERGFTFFQSHSVIFVKLRCFLLSRFLGIVIDTGETKRNKTP